MPSLETSNRCSVLNRTFVTAAASALFERYRPSGGGPEGFYYLYWLFSQMLTRTRYIWFITWSGCKTSVLLRPVPGVMVSPRLSCLSTQPLRSANYAERKDKAGWLPPPETAHACVCPPNTETGCLTRVNPGVIRSSSTESRCSGPGQGK